MVIRIENIVGGSIVALCKLDDDGIAEDVLFNERVDESSIDLYNDRYRHIALRVRKFGWQPIEMHLDMADIDGPIVIRQQADF